MPGEEALELSKMLTVEVTEATEIKRSDGSSPPQATIFRPNAAREEPKRPSDQRDGGVQGSKAKVPQESAQRARGIARAIWSEGTKMSERIGTQGT